MEGGPYLSTDSRVIYDSNCKTFRLYSGNSLYAFCISPELSLEHLYWGKRLPPNYDLRYLSQSARTAHFNTSEKYDAVLKDTVRDELFKNLQWESLEALQDVWRKNNSAKLVDYETSESALKRRIANLSWRLMSKLSSGLQHNDLDCHSTHAQPPSSVAHPGSLKSYQSCDDLQLSDLSIAFDEDQPNPHLRTRSQSVANLAPIMEESTDMSEDARISKAMKLQCNTSFSPKSPKTAGIPSVQLPSNPKKRMFERRGGGLPKGVINVEYSDHGTGDFRTPSFVVVDTYNGSSISPLRYRRHKIHKGRVNSDDSIPGVKRNIDESNCTTLVITMADVASFLEVDLIYIVLHEHDAIARSTVFRNLDTRVCVQSNGKCISTTKLIQRASSFTLDLEQTVIPFHLVQLSGSWGRERHIVETKLTHGIQQFGSTRGVSSHQHNPFAAVTIGSPSENCGEAKGFALAYSGNFQFDAELTEMGRLRINMGIHPMGFQWHLKSGQSFHTPEALLIRSGDGLGGMTRTFHRVLLEHVIHPLPQWARISPPVLLNTWEATYFDIDHTKVIEMTKEAAKLGIDMIVMDDGWFGERNDDTSSLGDWTVNPDKFPLGLSSLVDSVNQHGCRFGLWLEPEMVSEKSKLFREHNDWYLHVPGRASQVGRNQFVLDLSRKEVQDYLFQSISAILESARIDYIKWDMNRPLTEVYSLLSNDIDMDPVWQSETSHRYVLGLYSLLHRLTKRFPNVLLEMCASGGGRFDLGMLYFSPQIWCSDNTDALARIKIQYGSSLIYPASCIGAHVSTVPNHITGNTTRARTRCQVAMCGTFGFELDLSALSNSDKAVYREYIAVYKLLAPIIKNGDFYRLWNPFKSHYAGWMYVSRNQETAIVFAFSVNSDHWSNLVPRLFLRGLHPEYEYEITEPIPNNIIQNTGNLMIIESEVPVYQLGYQTVVMTGDILMEAGLPVRFYTLDDSIMYFLSRHHQHASNTNTSIGRNNRNGNGTSPMLHYPLSM